MYFAKIHDFTVGGYPNLFFFFLQPLSKQTTTSLVQLNYIKGRISVLKVNKLANFQSFPVNFMSFFSFLFLLFFEEIPIRKMKIISGYFLQWWTKWFLKTRHQFALRFQNALKIRYTTALKEPPECFSAGNRCSL